MSDNLRALAEAALQPPPNADVSLTIAEFRLAASPSVVIALLRFVEMIAANHPTVTGWHLEDEQAFACRFHGPLCAAWNQLRELEDQLSTGGQS